MHYKFLIIGSGPTGLGAGYRLKELGESSFLIAEKNNYSGGLSTTFTDDNGFLWDIGGHVQFSHYHYFDALMLKALGTAGWLEHQRESWVWMRQRFVPYPFQNNIRYLPQEELWACLEGIIHNYAHPPACKPKHFADWIQQTFGKGIAEVFMLPYNFKVWAYPPEELAYQWVGERVAVTDLRRVSRNIVFNEDDLSWGPNNTFQFPLKGGTGAIWKRVAEMIGESHIQHNKAVQSIHSDTQTVTFSDGSIATYDHLLSTMPLDLLTQMVEDLPASVSECASGLKHSHSHIVGIGLKGAPPAELSNKCWMYFPEDDCPFYRVTVFSNYSPNNVPDPSCQWSLMTETSESPVKPVDRAQLIEATIQGLLNTKLIQSRDDVISTWHHTAEYGYPSPSLERDAILAEVIPTLENMGIYSRGRFGAWKYEISNQDHSLMQGVEWANRMLFQVPETTLNFPNTANANWGKNL